MVSQDATVNARKECDLVMKGGITSGVIYPKLVAFLSSIYNFRNIGGTSAGAIAAAAAAAAQLGVKAGSNSAAFHDLEQLPQLLGGPATDGSGSMLLNLFQPQRPLRRHFKVLVRVLNAPSKSKLVLRVCMAIVKEFPLGAAIGAIPGVILLARSWGLGLVLSLAVLVLGLICGAAVAALRSFCRELPGNYFGMCNGMRTLKETGTEALTPWLDQYLNRLAGKSSGEPLTFGELWAGTIRKPGQTLPEVSQEDRAIQLAMMTTALNLGRPYRLPFEFSDIYFVHEELVKLFPNSVISWMVSHARPSETAKKLISPGRTFYALPRPEDFPIVVAVRLSLSFPILLSALPFYTIDRTLDVNKVEPTKATRVYFSDGGICSNFPMHFFDAPLPTRPTFGVNLRRFHPDHPAERVWLPELLRNNQGLKNYCPTLPDGPGFGSVAAFLWSIVNTMQNWRDQLQLAMPGFRDRIVHVSHSDKEGGLNLNMEPDVISALAASGAAAAEQLIKAFGMGGGLKSPNAWDNHQRIRVRTVLSLIEQQIEILDAVLHKQQDPTYEDIVLNSDPPSYEFETPQTAGHAATLLQDLRELARKWREQGIDFTTGAPKPSPESRIVPRV